MPKRKAAELLVEKTYFWDLSQWSWLMIAGYGILGILVTAIAVVTGLKLRSSKDEEEEEGFSEVVRTRRASLAEYERRSSVIYTPEEEAAFLEADRKRAKGKALEYAVKVDEAQVTRKYDDIVTNANNEIVKAVLEGTLAEGWTVQGSSNVSVLSGSSGNGMQMRCVKKCDVPSKAVVEYLNNNVCLGGHESSIYRSHDIATVEVPIKAPVITPSEVPEPNTVAIGTGKIRRFKCKEKSIFGTGSKRDYLVISVTFKLPSSEDGDGSFVVVHTSIPEDEVTSLSDVISPPTSPSSEPASPNPRRSVGDLVFTDEEGTTTADDNFPSSPTAKSPVRLHHKNDSEMAKLLGGSKTRATVAFSGFIVEANASNIGCTVHFASKAGKGDSISTDVKVASLDDYFKALSGKFSSLSALDDAAVSSAVNTLSAQVCAVSGEVASATKQKTPEEIKEEQRAKDEAKWAEMMDKDPVLAEEVTEGVAAGYSAVLLMHDYLDLPRDYLAEKSFVHNCPPGVKKPRRRRMSVMQMVGLEEVPDTPEMMKLAHAPRTLPKLNFEVKAQSSGVVCASAEVPGSTWAAVRATSVLQCTKKEVVKLLLDDSRISDFDDMLDSFTLLTRVNPYNAVRHMRFKAIWPTSGRDFVVCSTWEGDLYDLEPAIIAATSYKDSLAEPEKFPNLVRGSIPINGYLIEPFESILPEDAEKTVAECKMKPGDFGPGHVRVTFVNHIELNGTLPASVVNNLSVNAPVKLLRTIESVIKKDRSKK